MSCFHPVSVPYYKFENGDKMKHYALVPCGKCLACLAEMQSQWSFRIEQEVVYGGHATSLFVTFTYDNEHLPDDFSVHKEEVQRYLHDLRQLIDRRYCKEDRPRLKYYFCAEYGSKRGRPH